MENSNHVHWCVTNTGWCRWSVSWLGHLWTPDKGQRLWMRRNLPEKVGTDYGKWLWHFLEWPITQPRENKMWRLHHLTFASVDICWEEAEQTTVAGCGKELHLLDLSQTVCEPFLNCSNLRLFEVVDQLLLPRRKNQIKMTQNQNR